MIATCRALLLIALLTVPSLAGGVLHEGGVFDFEDGFILYSPSIFADKPWDEVGKGWSYWGQPAVFMPEKDRFGHPAFNRNQFRPNVSSATFSQEITMTSANGDGLMWISFEVPVGRVIRCSLDAITTPSKDHLQLRHAIGQGGPLEVRSATDPFALPLRWEEWDIETTNNHFATNSVSVASTTDTLTYYFWVRHAFATSTGATLCFDNLVVSDDGPAPAAALSVGLPCAAGCQHKPLKGCCPASQP